MNKTKKTKLECLIGIDVSKRLKNISDSQAEALKKIARETKPVTPANAKPDVAIDWNTTPKPTILINHNVKQTPEYKSLEERLAVIRNEAIENIKNLVPDEFTVESLFKTMYQSGVAERIRLEEKNEQLEKKVSALQSMCFELQDELRKKGQ